MAPPSVGHIIAWISLDYPGSALWRYRSLNYMTLARLREFAENRIEEASGRGLVVTHCHHSILEFLA